MPIAIQLGKAIRDRGITVSHVARKIGMSEKTLWAKLRGTRRLTADELIAVCREVGIDLDTLASWKTDTT